MRKYDETNSYVRPLIESPVFRDADGTVIEYGNRWHGSPPEDTYSVDTHPERFAPLHAVAEALIAHLQGTYDVEIDEGVEVAGELLHPAFHDVVRAVRIRPNDPKCASLTFVFTAYPGIYMHAGLLHDFQNPICGCDACDSNWQAEADELEQQVFATVNGNYTETIERGLRPWVNYAFNYPNGTSGGRSRSEDLPPQRLRDAKPTLRDLRNGWNPWPLSTSASSSTRPRWATDGGTTTVRPSESTMGEQRGWRRGRHGALRYRENTYPALIQSSARRPRPDRVCRLTTHPRFA